jgi:hypothetical protein
MAAAPARLAGPYPEPVFQPTRTRRGTALPGLDLSCVPYPAFRARASAWATMFSIFSVAMTAAAV